MTDLRLISTRCPECGHAFFNGWESIQHQNGRHHYRAHTREDGARLAEERHRPLEPPPIDPATIEGRYARALEGEQ